jgi:VCBS repeat protein/ASPIC/UnbV protein
MSRAPVAKLLPFPLLLAVSGLAAAQSSGAPAPTDAGSCCRKNATVPLEKPADQKEKTLVLYDCAMKLRANMAPFLGGGAVGEFQKRVAALKPDSPPNQVFMLRKSLGDSLLAIGEIEAAEKQYEVILPLALQAKDITASRNVARAMAMGWMRLGERRNCVGRHNEDSCLFPLQGNAIHVDQEGSRRAIEILTEMLKTDGSDLASLWLLNVANMTLGTWPDSVPPQWRIRPESLQSESPMPRMYDVAGKLGLDSFCRAGGSCFDDFNGDGLMDVVVSSMDPEQPLKMFRQAPDGTFKNVAKEVGLEGQLGGLQFIHFDANNDGRLDLLVQRGAWMRNAGEMPNSLLIQQQDGTFLDTTKAAGIEVWAPSQVAAVADVDNDGDLDLFLGYEGEEQGAEARYTSRLFLNRGDATFEDVTKRAHVENGHYCKGAAFADYDGDRLPDLYVSNMHAPNRLYHNNGDGTFTDVALTLGVGDPYDSFACWFFDYNNDGRLDLYVTCYSQNDRSAQIGAFYRNHTTGCDSNRLYENDGHGGFKDVTCARALDRVVFPMGCNFGDVDNDGWQDLYLATGDPEFSSLWPNVMYRNDGGQRFQDVTAATDTGHLQKGHGVSFGDFDDDGDQDLFVKMGGAFKDDGAADCLFENPGHGNHWLTVRLVGHKSNRFGIGARICATIDEPGSGERKIFAFAGMNSSFGGNSLQEEMGLGKATRIVELEVDWPTSQITQKFHDVPLDRTIVVDELQPKVTLLSPRVRPAAGPPGAPAAAGTH